jgi:hypothetical protein
MQSLVERLREWEDYLPAKEFVPEMLKDTNEAADKIEELLAERQGRAAESAHYMVENANLRAAILKYAGHTSDCRWRGGHDCTCGLDELRSFCRQ